MATNCIHAFPQKCGSHDHLLASKQLNMATTKGYHCEFLDTVPDIFLCKKCSLVARRLTVTSCCRESFCHACISEPKEQNKPCPECGEEDFTLFNQVKFQRQINKLQVYCTHKERGCGWSGPLEQLEVHLDPDQDHCQCVDTKCPFNCQQTIPKNKVEQHVAEECVRRDFTCQHCNFKATYEEVVGTHLAECSYVPLQCPNRCGVTCERDVMEDHMRICRLEEVECEFSGMGCEERPKREDQEEHARQSTQKHITLTATAAMKTREIVQQRLDEQERLTQKKLQDQEQRLQASTTKIREMQQRLDEQEKLTRKKFQDLEQRLQASTTKTREMQQRLDEQEKLAQKKLLDYDQRLQASTTKTREIVKQRLDEQERLTQKKLQDQEQSLQASTTKIREMQQRLDEQEKLTQKKLLDQEQSLQASTTKIREMQQRLDEQEKLTWKKFQDLEQRLQASTTKTREMQQRLDEQEKLTQKKLLDYDQRLQASTTKTREIVKQRLDEQERLTQKKLQDQEQRLQASTTKIREMQQRLDEQERLTRKKFQDQEQRLQASTTKTREIVHRKLDEEMQTLRTSVEFLQQKLLEKLLVKLEEKEKKIQQLSVDLSRFMITQNKTEEAFQKQIQDARIIRMLNLNFKIENLKKLMGISYWRSPPMITHGYRFVVELDLSRTFRNGGRGITVDFDALQGDLDRELEWPVHMKLNYEVLNNYGDTLFVGIWKGYFQCVGVCREVVQFCPDDAIPVSKVLPKLYDSALYFNIVNALIV